MVWSALLFGLLGSLHCVGMCGPIAFLLPLDRRSPSKRFFQLIGYHGGRLLTYSILGALFGLAGKSLQLFGIQQQLSIAIGVLMVMVVLIPVKTFNKYNFSRPIYAWVGKIKSSMGAELQKKDPFTFFTIGVLNGLLPCGLVYIAIFGAIAFGGPRMGAAYMALFGLGTIPLMTTAVYLGNFLKGTVKKKVVKAIPVLVIIIGLLFIVRGLGLGIKYISPAPQVTTELVGSSQSCH
jgi:sulfite exporter TauE/SafE